MAVEWAAMRLEMPRFAWWEMAEMVDVTVSMADTGLRAEATKTRGERCADADTAGGATVGGRAGVEG